MSIRVKYDTFTDSLIMSNDTPSPSRITIPNWAMDLVTKDYKHEIDRLKAENAKLRELARTLINCADSISVEGVYYERDVDGCGFDCTVNGENCSFAKMCNRARELGVEVEE